MAKESGIVNGEHEQAVHEAIILHGLVSRESTASHRKKSSAGQAPEEAGALAGVLAGAAAQAGAASSSAAPAGGGPPMLVKPMMLSMDRERTHTPSPTGLSAGAVAGEFTTPSELLKISLRAAEVPEEKVQALVAATRRMLGPAHGGFNFDDVVEALCECVAGQRAADGGVGEVRVEAETEEAAKAAVERLFAAVDGNSGAGTICGVSGCGGGGSVGGGSSNGNGSSRGNGSASGSGSGSGSSSPDGWNGWNGHETMLCEKAFLSCWGDYCRMANLLKRPAKQVWQFCQQHESMSVQGIEKLWASIAESNEAEKKGKKGKSSKKGTQRTAYAKSATWRRSKCPVPYASRRPATCCCPCLSCACSCCCSCSCG
jgi:hypothetical protein